MSDAMGDLDQWVEARTKADQVMDGAAFAQPVGCHCGLDGLERIKAQADHQMGAGALPGWLAAVGPGPDRLRVGVLRHWGQAA